MRKNNNNQDDKISKHDLIRKRDNIEKISEVIENKKVILKKEQDKINSKIFENIAYAIIIMLFFYFIILGSINISPESFLTDLKVFSILLVIFFIFLVEKSYKKSDKNLCIHGIEILFVAISTLSAIYIYSLFVHRFKMIVALISFGFGIYYILKSIIIYINLRKKYYKEENDIKDIIKKEK